MVLTLESCQTDRYNDVNRTKVLSGSSIGCSGYVTVTYVIMATIKLPVVLITVLTRHDDGSTIWQLVETNMHKKLLMMACALKRIAKARVSRVCRYTQELCVLLVFLPGTGSATDKA